MWIVYVRERSYAAHWTGRRRWGALDAIAWPLGWIVLAQGLPPASGALRPLIVAICIVAAMLRLRRALCENHRYWFSTWRWGRILLATWLAGIVMRTAAGG